MRKLATFRTVLELKPIEGAEFIETAVIDGWQCVVKKDEFKLGDTGIYFEIDSFLPADDPRYSFLEKNFQIFEGKQGARLRTIRLRGTLSQGLLLPKTSFPETLNFTDNDDLSALLGIKKWDPPLPAQMAGLAKGLYPDFIPKTDQERIQNIPDIIFQEAKNTYEVSVKIDGSSMTAYQKAGEFGVCSRNYELKEDENNTLWEVANRYGTKFILTQLKRDLALQGELYGEGIQDNPEKNKGQDWRIFDIFSIDEGRYLNPGERMETLDMMAKIAQENNLPVLQSVPIVGKFQLERFNSLDAILDFANGNTMDGTNVREGLVYKREDGKISFKTISNDYLLKQEKRNSKENKIKPKM